MKLRNFFKKFFGRKKKKAPRAFTPSRQYLKQLERSLTKLNTSVRSHASGLSKLDFDWKWLHWAVIILAVYLAASILIQVLGLLIRPDYTPIATKTKAKRARKVAPTDYETILRRNMFNVEGQIPEPFEQGLLDCMSQAKPSRAGLKLLGTIVMQNDKYSVALIQEPGATDKTAIRTDEAFINGKYTAMKIERKKLCFQVRATEQFEFIEIAEAIQGPSLSLPSTGGTATGGIAPVSENKYSIKRTYLEQKLSNLNEILQSARAVPYIENGKFQGFLIQSLDDDSIFRQLGVNRGDVLRAVNDIVLDNAGKGLEAFQRLRNSETVTLELDRGGQRKTLTYDVK